jgi:enolase
MKIVAITPRMIMDSRGYPTVEVDVILEGGVCGRAATPSGASTGSREALELRDSGPLFAGKGVGNALTHIRKEITPMLLNKEFASQRDLDTLLCTIDGTPNKSRLGANALLPISLAYAKAVALQKNIPLYKHLREEFTFQKDISLPMPLINVLNGGKHAPHSTDVQEWMIVPKKATSFSQALEHSSRVFYTLRDMMYKRGVSGVGDEGGFPIVNAISNREALILLTRAVKEAGLIPGEDIVFALDVASSEFYDNGRYTLTCDNGSYTTEEMITYLRGFREHFPVVSIEDGLSEDDWDGWKRLTEMLGATTQLVGDDLFVTNTTYLKRGIDEHAGNAILIKVNQIGTLTETVDAIEMAHSNGFRTIISHRSGETEDTTIAHLAVASGAGQIKTGSLSRTERLAKYNELLRIEEEVKEFAHPFL